MCQKTQSRAPVPLLHLPYISTPRQIPSQANTTMLRVLSYVGEATPGKRLPLNSPPTGDSESRGLFKGFPAQRACVTAMHWAWLSCRRARVGLEMWDPHGEPGARFAVGLRAGTASAPPCPALGHKAVQAPEMCHLARCLRPEGNIIGIFSFFLFSMGTQKIFRMFLFRCIPTWFGYMSAYIFSCSFPCILP